VISWLFGPGRITVRGTKRKQNSRPRGAAWRNRNGYGNQARADSVRDSGGGAMAWGMADKGRHGFLLSFGLALRLDRELTRTKADRRRLVKVRAGRLLKRRAPPRAAELAGGGVGSWQLAGGRNACLRRGRPHLPTSNSHLPRPSSFAPVTHKAARCRFYARAPLPFRRLRRSWQLAGVPYAAPEVPPRAAELAVGRRQLAVGRRPLRRP
jgi:hypothetical protein